MIKRLYLNNNSKEAIEKLDEIMGFVCVLTHKNEKPSVLCYDNLVDEIKLLVSVEKEEDISKIKMFDLIRSKYFNKYDLKGDSSYVTEFYL